MCTFKLYVTCYILNFYYTNMTMDIAQYRKYEKCELKSTRLPKVRSAPYQFAVLGAKAEVSRHC